MKGDIIRAKIKSVEAQMQAKLDEIRTTFSHPGDKGCSVEHAFREFLRCYLPRRLAVGHGEIIDTNERRSNQTDIVIVNEDHPMTFSTDSPGLFFVEGVSAAGELKTNLTSSELTNALKNSMNFKLLEMQMDASMNAWTNPSDLNRYYKHAPYFLVAFSSQMKLSTVLENIQEFMKKGGLDADKVNTILDAVFIVGQGTIINFGDGQGNFRFVTSGGSTAKGWVIIQSETVLFDLLNWLSCVIPRITTSQSILPKYTVESKPGS